MFIPGVEEEMDKASHEPVIDVLGINKVGGIATWYYMVMDGLDGWKCGIWALQRTNVNGFDDMGGLGYPKEYRAWIWDGIWMLYTTYYCRASLLCLFRPLYR